METIRGKVWKLGDNVDTDALAPFATLTGSWEDVKAGMLRRHRGLVEGARKGDIVVAGKNFGCGSSRENAPENLKQLGLGAVLADSFGRIFFRNSVAIALPVLACPGVSGLAGEGDEIEVDVEQGLVKNVRTGAFLTTRPYTAEMLDILQHGGLMKVLEKRFAAGS